MQETTPEQSARLQSFAEQRDVLQGEVTSLTKEKDTLSAVNKELTQTNASLVAEIASNDNKLKNYLDGIQEQVEAAYAQKRIADNERIEAESKAKSALRELDLIVGLVSNLKDMTSGIENTAAEVNSNLKEATGRVNVFLTQIKEASDDVVASSTNVKNAAERFADVVSKEHEAVAKKSNAIDKKEIMLNDRETAINELVSDYKKTLKGRK